jgi:phosphotransferase system HPr (HPr) family protein
MVEKVATIRNRDGIHCRPSSAILTAVGEFPGVTFMVSCDRGESDLGSILSLLALGLQKGDEVVIQATGPQEEAACKRIADLFEFEFDFPPRT